jgi:hypothetical protein
MSRVVLPRLVTGLALHLRRTRSVADAPVARSLRLVMRDEIEQWQVTEALAQSLLRRPHDVAVVTAHQARLEEFVTENGPGLVPWPEAGVDTDVASASPTMAPPGFRSEVVVDGATHRQDLEQSPAGAQRGSATGDAHDDREEDAEETEEEVAGDSVSRRP